MEVKLEVAEECMEAWVLLWVLRAKAMQVVGKDRPKVGTELRQGQLEDISLEPSSCRSSVPGSVESETNRTKECLLLDKYLDVLKTRSNICFIMFLKYRVKGYWLVNT